MDCCFVEPHYIHPKNISYRYTINHYKSIKSLEGIKTVKLSSIATEITDGTRIKRNYIDEGVRLINVGDFKDGTIYQPSIKSISAEGLREKDYIKENDVLVTAVGRSGQVVRVTSNLEDCVISSDIIRIRLKQPFTARRLVAYLNSEAGQYALESIKSGLINRISISDIKELKIPADYESISFNEPIQTNNRKDAYRLYEACKDILNNYIVQDADLFKVSNSVYINGNEINVDRLDPKYYTYFQSKLYKTIHNGCSNICWQPLGQVVKIKKAIKPKMDENQIVEYINISNVDDDLSIITSTEKDLYKNLSSRIRYVLEKNELITAKSGSATGTKKHVTAVITDKHEGMMASDAFYNIKPVSIDPFYLLFLFKQPIILKQIEAGSIGLYFKTINRREFENIRIPRLSIKEESEIAENMKNYVYALM